MKYSVGVFCFIFQVQGLLRRETLSSLATGEAYSCPPKSGTSNDTIVDIFTSKRMPTQPWPIINVEVPKSYAEFMCGIQNRNITSDCMCGYLFPWDSPQTVNMYMRAVSFDSDIVFFDSFKQVVSFQSVPAYSQQTITSVPNIQYILVVPKGITSLLGVQKGDPANFTIPQNTYIGTGVSNYDDRVGMHD